MKYKITISEVTEKEVPVTEYMNTHKKNERSGDDIYGYIPTGEQRIDRNERDIYVQEIEDLNIQGLVTYINDR